MDVAYRSINFQKKQDSDNYYIADGCVDVCTEGGMWRANIYHDWACDGRDDSEGNIQMYDLLTPFVDTFPDNAESTISETYTRCLSSILTYCEPRTDVIYRMAPDWYNIELRTALLGGTETIGPTALESVDTECSVVAIETHGMDTSIFVCDRVGNVHRTLFRRDYNGPQHRFFRHKSPYSRLNEESVKHIIDSYHTARNWVLTEGIGEEVVYLNPGVSIGLSFVPTIPYTDDELQESNEVAIQTVG